MALNILSILLFLLTHLTISGAHNHDTLFGASFIFGDSLVDAGNNNYFLSLSNANCTPYGIDFKPSGGNPTGRFTNGRTISDITGEELGNPNYAVPFLAPNATGEAILSGVNYASGGSGILNESGQIYGNRLGMDIQIDYFNITRKQIDKLLGESNARDYIMKKSIFSIAVGNNDILTNNLSPAVSSAARKSDSPHGYIDSIINHFRLQLIRLYEMDARKLVISNLGPLGCIPNQKDLNNLNEDECAELANNLAVQYNGRLKELLDELNHNLPGATFVLVNVYDLMMDLITNYDKYGFTTASRACCGDGGQFGGIIPCGPASSLCIDRNEHLFWDPYHPNEVANLILAKQLLDGNNTFISPINLRQLWSL